MGNHRSFRDEQELVLIPAYAKDRRAVPVAAIYGANASGKSNLLNGLKFMADAVRDSFGVWSRDAGVPRSRFRLDRSPERPSAFVVELVADDVRYVYGFEVDDERVRAEWLYGYPEKRKRVIFERESDEIRFGTTVGDARGKLEVFEGLVRSNALLLSLTGQVDLPVTRPVHRWFTHDLTFRLDGPEVTEAAVKRFVLGSETRRRRFFDLARAADFGISSVLLTLSLSASDEEGPTGSVDVEVDWDAVGRVDSRAADTLRDVLLSQGRLGLKHGGGAVFRLEDESAGTRAWLGLLPVALTVLESGGVLVVDEIDASLHPQLTARLVALFRDAGTNARSAQLLFTTHDASLLSPALGEEVLARDEIWFVEKKPDGASELYPLTDFHPRKEGENLERRYLGGSYGAVPNLMVEDFIDALRGPGSTDDPA